MEESKAIEEPKSLKIKKNEKSDGRLEILNDFPKSLKTGLRTKYANFTDE